MPDSDVGQIADPDLVGSCGIEVALDVIPSNGVRVVGIGRGFIGSALPSFDSLRTHQSCDVSFEHCEPCSLQLFRPPRGTVKLLHAILAPCVKTRLADFENLAHHLNLKFVRVTHHERGPFRSLEEKMVMAFFRK